MLLTFLHFLLNFLSLFLIFCYFYYIFTLFVSISILKSHYFLFTCISLFLLICISLLIRIILILILFILFIFTKRLLFFCLYIINIYLITRFYISIFWIILLYDNTIIITFPIFLLKIIKLIFIKLLLFQYINIFLSKCQDSRILTLHTIIILLFYWLFGFFIAKAKRIILIWKDILSLVFIFNFKILYLLWLFYNRIQYKFVVLCLFLWMLMITFFSIHLSWKIN